MKLKAYLIALLCVAAAGVQTRVAVAQGGELQELADKLLAAGSADERVRLLREEKGLLSEELVYTFVNAGERALGAGNAEAAIHFSDIALDVATVQGGAKPLALCRLYRGWIFQARQRYPLALAEFRAALQTFERLAEPHWHAKSLGSVGDIYALTGRYEEARDSYAASLGLARAARDGEIVAETLGALGEVNRLTGEYAKALEQFTSSLALMRERGDLKGVAAMTNNVGAVYSSSGLYDEALGQYAAALRAARAAEYPAGVAKTLNSVGIVYGLTGRFSEALAMYEQSLDVSRQYRDRAGASATLHNMGELYVLTGRLDDALRLYRESLAIKEAIGNRAGRARTLNTLGIIHRKRGEYREALACFLESAVLMDELGNRAGVVAPQGNITFIYEALGEHDEARRNLEKVLMLTRDGGDRAGEAATLLNLGNVYAAMGKADEALKFYADALKLAQAIGDGPTVSKAYISKGQLFRARGDWVRAAEAFETAVRLVESLRDMAAEPSLKTSFFEQYTAPYHGLFECMLEMKRDEDAFRVGEQVKARTLVELMAAASVNITRAMTEAEKRRERGLNAGLLAAAARLNSASMSAVRGGEVDALKRQLAAVRAEYEDFRRRLYVLHPEARVQRARFDPADLRTINRELFARAPDLCILSYTVTDGRTVLFVLTHGTDAASSAALRTYALKDADGHALKADELTRRVYDFRRRIAKSDEGLYKGSARELYRLLIGPAERELEGKTHVVIIPDAALSKLPFAALVDGRGKHFVEAEFGISYAPSVTALMQMTALGDEKRKTPPPAAALFAIGRRTFDDQPRYRGLDLPFAEEQVNGVAALFRAATRAPVKAYTGSSATKARAAAEMGAARYVHFATHGELNEEAPMYSALVLAPGAGDDGMLYARDFTDMSMRAELIVLSACQSGLGKETGGEGVLGLTWSMFVAGAPGSVVSQWSHRDDSSAKLMLAFYEALNPRDASVAAPGKARALQRAQLSLLRSETYSHPFYWAAFVLMGDWR